VDESATVELVEVRKRFGGVPVLDGITLTVNRGEIFGYLGPNGAGKTTTLKILTGLIQPTSGEIRIGGKNIAADPLGAKTVFGYVPESGAIFEKLTPREYLRVSGALYAMSPDAIASRTVELLDEFGLGPKADQRMDIFSKGMKQKICFASALLHEPAVLILDEPLIGLDVETVVLVKELLKRLAASGKTVFYTSHQVDVVEKICDRLAILHRGRIIESGTVGEVVSRSQAGNLEEALMALWTKKSGAFL
jgi:ABC-2 type transport system ATP-binding protein